MVQWVVLCRVCTSLWTVLSVDPSCALESVMGVRDKTKSHIHPYAGRTEHRTRRPALNGNRMRHAPRRSRVASHAAIVLATSPHGCSFPCARQRSPHSAARCPRTRASHMLVGAREWGRVTTRALMRLIRAFLRAVGAHQRLSLSGVRVRTPRGAAIDRQGVPVEQDCQPDEAHAKDKRGGDLKVEEKVRGDGGDDDRDRLREPAHDVVGVLDRDCDEQAARDVHHDGRPRVGPEAVQPPLARARRVLLLQHRRRRDEPAVDSELDVAQPERRLPRPLEHPLKVDGGEGGAQRRRQHRHDTERDIRAHRMCARRHCRGSAGAGRQLAIQKRRRRHCGRVARVALAAVPLEEHLRSGAIRAGEQPAARHTAAPRRLGRVLLQQLGEDPLH
mmetsp:Transcript_7530/g.24994  ORF Transcript_7530/g.24994 Transcript_7530/m.24994 type:complete len:389 (+) Transcript_7530:3-1169(+)